MVHCSDDGYVDGVRDSLWTAVYDGPFILNFLIYEYREPRWNNVDMENY
jgi:hypothetical protein